MGEGGKSAPVAKNSQQNPSGIPIPLDTCEEYLWNILGVSMSAGWFLCHSLCMAVHGCTGVTRLGDSQRSRARRELLHKPCVAAARSALPVPHPATSHLERGDAVTAPVPHCPAQTGDRGPVGCWQDLVMGELSLFAVLTQSQQGGKPPNSVGQPVGSQAGTKPKSSERESVLLR